MLRGWIIAALLASCACVARRNDTLPPSEGARAIVLVIERDGRAMYAFAARDNREISGTYSLRDGMRIYAHFYDRTLDELGIVPGALSLLTDPLQGRPLPPAERIAIGSIGGRDLTWRAWSSGEPLPEVTIPRFELSECLRRGGCLPAGSAELGSCVVPCPPVAPIEPALPKFAECPAGWTRRTTRAGAEYCRPREPPPRASCASPNQAQRRGESTCSRIGSLCPATWPSELPSERPILYARPGPPGGTGQKGNPIGSISEALAVARAGEVIALARGEYSELGPLRIPAGVSVYGACAEGTVLEARVELEAAGVELRELQVRAQLAARAGATLILKNVAIADSSTTGPALLIEGGATATVSASAIDSAIGSGIRVHSGARAKIEDTVVHFRIDHGVLVDEPGSHARLFDVAVYGPAQPAAEEPTAVGLYARYAGRISGERVSVADTVGGGIYLFDQASANLRDLEVARTRAGAGGGHGLVADTRAVATLDSAFFFDNRSSAATAINRSTLNLSRVVAAGLRGLPDQEIAFGFAGTLGSHLSLSEVAIVDSDYGALMIQTEGSRMQAREVIVENLGPAGATFMAAIHAGFGARLDLRRASIENVAATAVLLTEPDPRSPSFFLEDLTVEGATAMGLDFSEAATVQLSRASVADTGFDAARVLLGASLIADSVELLGPSRDEQFSGLHVAGTSSVGMSNFSIRGFAGSSGARITYDRGLANTLHVRLERGEIAGNRVGVSSDRPELHPEHVTRGVLYQNNGTDLLLLEGR